MLASTRVTFTCSFAQARARACTVACLFSAIRARDTGRVMVKEKAAVQGRVLRQIFTELWMEYRNIWVSLPNRDMSMT